jgi:hypothetical protein
VKYKRRGEDGLSCTHCEEGQIIAWYARPGRRYTVDWTDIRDMSIFFRKLLEERARLDSLDRV